MKEAIAFDDVLIVPKFSTVASRKDVDLTSNVGGVHLKLPVISANMDTVTGPKMAQALSEVGGVGCLHRFQTIEENIKQFKESNVLPWASIGLGVKELDRAVALFDTGANMFVIDVAHGATEVTVKQVNKLYELIRGNAGIIVGNFATGQSIQDFHSKAPYVAAYKVGIGGGSACTTRIKTGCGLPTLYSVMDSVKTGHNIIADGGMKTPGDVAKALAAGAKGVMLGGMLAGTDETPGDMLYINTYNNQLRTQEDVKLYGFVPEHYKPIKTYRGSASKESYEVQGKDEAWRTAEGESFTVKYKGSVKDVLKDIEGGLRSAFSYVGATNLREFQEQAKFVKISSNGVKENGAHGKNN